MSELAVALLLAALVVPPAPSTANGPPTSAGTCSTLAADARTSTGKAEGAARDERVQSKRCDGAKPAGKSRIATSTPAGAASK